MSFRGFDVEILDRYLRYVDGEVTVNWRFKVRALDPPVFDLEKVSSTLVMTSHFDIMLTSMRQQM